jgi:hypothetical protein
VERQLALFDEDALDAALRRRPASRFTIEIRYRETRRQIYAWRFDAAENRFELRAHVVFRRAPDEVADAVWRIVLGRPPRVERRRLAHVVHAWFQTATAAAGRPAARRAPPPDAALGRHVDLRPLFDAVRTERLPPGFDADLAWTPRAGRTLFARYERGEPRGRIVVNALLDAPLTPRWYLDFLLFHEALHGVLPPRPGRGRMIVHPPEFRAAERAHPGHARARGFERWATGPGFEALRRRENSPGLRPPEFD